MVKLINSPRVASMLMQSGDSWTYAGLCRSRRSWKESGNVDVMRMVTMTIGMNLLAKVSAVNHVTRCKVQVSSGQSDDTGQEQQCPAEHLFVKFLPVFIINFELKKD